MIDRQEGDKQRRPCVSAVDRRLQDQLVVATEQTAAVDQSAPHPTELFVFIHSQVKLVCSDIKLDLTCSACFSYQM